MSYTIYNILLYTERSRKFALQIRRIVFVYYYKDNFRSSCIIRHIPFKGNIIILYDIHYGRRSYFLFLSRGERYERAHAQQTRMRRLYTYIILYIIVVGSPRVTLIKRRPMCNNTYIYIYAIRTRDSLALNRDSRAVESSLIYERTVYMTYIRGVYCITITAVTEWLTGGKKNRDIIYYTFESS